MQATLARVSEIRGESRLFQLVSYGAGTGFGVLPMSAPGGVAGEAEDAGELVLDRGGLGEHAVGSGPAAVAVVEQDGLADPGELAEQFATDIRSPARVARRRIRWASWRASTQVKT